METVSVLIPCYNNERFVGNAIESALEQTWPCCEVIVVDDGSTDNSLSVAKEYEPEGVQVIHQPNRGPSSARNRALKAATGEYIQYLDADDFLDPEKIKAQVQALRELGPRTVAFCPTIRFWDGEPPKSGQRMPKTDQVPGLDSDEPAQWLVNLWDPTSDREIVQTGAWLTPWSLIADVGGWDEQITVDDDGEYFTRVILESDRIRYVPDGRVYYRQYHGSRVSSWRSRFDLKGWLRAIDSKRDHLLPNTTGETHDAACRALAHQYLTLACESYPNHEDIAVEAERRARDLEDGLANPPQIQGSRLLDNISKFSNWWTARHLQHTYRRMRDFILKGNTKRPKGK